MRINANEPADAAVRELGARFRFRIRPALALLTHAGDLLHVQYARLYPAYHFNGVEMSTWTERLWTSEDILAMVDRVEREQARVDARLRALAARDDPAAVVERAGILADRARPAQAQALLESAFEQGDVAEAGMRLAQLHLDLGRWEEARVVYRDLVAKHPEHAEVRTWRMLAARMLVMQGARSRRDAETGAYVDAEYADAMRTLDGLAAQTDDPVLAVRARLSLARAANAAGESEALGEHLAWLHREIPDVEDCPAGWTAEMLLELGDLELMAGGEHEARATRRARAVARCFPDSVEAQRIKHGMLDGNIRTSSPR